MTTESRERLTDMLKSFNQAGSLSDMLYRAARTALVLTGASEGIAILKRGETEQGIRCLRNAPDMPISTCMADYPRAARAMKNGPGSEQTRPDDTRIFIPMHTHNGVTGVIGVVRQADADGFHAGTVDTLTGLAQYAGLALENIALTEEMNERQRAFRLMTEALNAVSWPLDLGAVVHAIARHMMYALSADWCIITGKDAAEGIYHRLAEYRRALWEVPSSSETESAFITRLIKTPGMNPIQITEQNATPEEHICLSEANWKRVLLVPLHEQGEMAGLVELFNVQEETPFPPSRVAQTIRLAREVPQYLSPSAAPDWAEQIKILTQDMISISEADGCTIYTAEPAGEKVSKVISYGTGIWTDTSGPVLPLDDCPTMRIVTTEQRIAYLSSSHPNLTEMQRSQFDLIGQGAILILPLVVTGRTVGVVQIYDLDPERTFTPRETALAQTLANQAAIALEKARLVTDLQHSLEQQKTMQSQLVHAARLSGLGEMAAMVAHQINNPLTTVLADAEMLAQDTPEDDPRYASVEAIRRAGKRAKLVVERILTMARAEDEKQPLSVNDTIYDTLKLLEAQISRLDINLRLELADDLPLVEAFGGQLEDVWMNLIINARDAITQHNPEHGSIVIRSALVEDGTMIQVTVTDDGMGIEESDLQRIFDPLFTTKPRGKGTGLGLYVCRQIVSDHDGQITVESEPEQGTTATVLLPVLSRTAKD